MAKVRIRLPLAANHRWVTYKEDAPRGTRCTKTPQSNVKLRCDTAGSVEEYGWIYTDRVPGAALRRSWKWITSILS